MSEKQCVKHLLDAIWNEDMRGAKVALMEGANPSHRVNGFPLLLHAVYTRNVSMVQLLIRFGALQTSEALGFALEHGYGEMVLCLLDLGVLPQQAEVKRVFGPFPCRQTALVMFGAV